MARPRRVQFLGEAFLPETFKPRSYSTKLSVAISLVFLGITQPKARKNNPPPEPAGRDYSGRSLLALISVFSRMEYQFLALREPGNGKNFAQQKRRSHDVAKRFVFIHHAEDEPAAERKIKLRNKRQVNVVVSRDGTMHRCRQTVRSSFFACSKNSRSDF